MPAITCPTCHQPFEVELDMPCVECANCRTRYSTTGGILRPLPEPLDLEAAGARWRPGGRRAFFLVSLLLVGVGVMLIFLSTYFLLFEMV